jgi:hypothetical protein
MWEIQQKGAKNQKGLFGRNFLHFIMFKRPILKASCWPQFKGGKAAADGPFSGLPVHQTLSVLNSLTPCCMWGASGKWVGIFHSVSATVTTKAFSARTAKTHPLALKALLAFRYVASGPGKRIMELAQLEEGSFSDIWQTSPFS